jgi:tetratricopeptide (TPR) repeat protein
MYENGGYEGGGNDNDGSEIYINENANVIMIEGCNSVYDDREPSGSLINTLLLMNGDNIIPPISVEAQYNYWGETEVTSDRFGDLEVSFDEYLSEPCPLPEGGEGDMLLMQTSTGEVVDTLYPTGEFVGTLGEIELLYAGAEKSYITGDYASAENYYDQIIAIDTVITVKKEAYARKYAIGRLLGKEEEYFSDLMNVYLSLSQSSSNSMLEKTFNQLSALCLVGEKEYIPAIGEFDEIIQQNPNTEEAVYAEIDALTTALLIEESDSTLQKGRLGKYLVKSSGDYTKQVDKILRKFFGNEIQENEKELLPTEYTLHQNYPNPFNPTTTIKYDLPNISEVSLIIYDILGRKVKELVNTKQQAGRYEIQFNASNLASGVYIYQLMAEKFISSKKMILLK